MKITIYQLIVMLIFTLSISSHAVELRENNSCSNSSSFTNRVSVGCTFGQEYKKVGSLKAKLIEQTCPEFKSPNNAYKNSENATVRLNLLISSDGIVKDSQLLRSSGHKDLDEETKKVFHSCRFKPAITRDRIAFESWLVVVYVWHFESSMSQIKP